MRRNRLRYACLGLIASLVAQVIAAPAVRAETDVTVAADQAKVLSISGTPSTVVVGNPMIADVSIQGGILAVHGRHFGSTNVIILDSQGNQLTALQVHVVRMPDDNVVIFKGANEGKYVGKFSYTCSPNCESALMPGDDADYNAATVAQITAKSKEAVSSAQSQ
jgi:hypothetical protein